jgi:hypothetical protein
MSVITFNLISQLMSTVLFNLTTINSGHSVLQNCTVNNSLYFSGGGCSMLNHATGLFCRADSTRPGAVSSLPLYIGAGSVSVEHTGTGSL